MIEMLEKPNPNQSYASYHHKKINEKKSMQPYAGLEKN